MWDSLSWQLDSKNENFIKWWVLQAIRARKRKEYWIRALSRKMEK